MVRKRMLKPCANISVLPFDRPGSISLYTAAAVWSGTSTMITSAHCAASATESTSSPEAFAFSAPFEPARRPTFTSTPLSFRLSACAWPCEP